MVGAGENIFVTLIAGLAVKFVVFETFFSGPHTENGSVNNRFNRVFLHSFLSYFLFSFFHLFQLIGSQFMKMILLV